MVFFPVKKDRDAVSHEEMIAFNERVRARKNERLAAGRMNFDGVVPVAKRQDEFIAEMSDEQFEKELKSHDWFFDFSEDRRVVVAGRAAERVLYANALKSEDRMKMFNKANKRNW